MNNKGVKKKINLSKKKLLFSAMELFALNGFKSTTTRDICNHAGVNLSLIPYYFGNKDGLYINIIESVTTYGINYLQNEIAKANYLAFMSREEKIELYYTILKKYADFVYSDRVPYDFILLLLREQTVLNSKFSELYLGRIKVVYDAMCKIISSITGIDESDQSIIIEIFAIVGQIISLKLINSMLLNYVKIEKLTPKQESDVKAMVNSFIIQHVEKIQTIEPKKTCREEITA